MGEDQATQQHAHCHSCLVSDSTILLPYKHSAHDGILQQKYWTGMFTTQDHAQENWKWIPIRLCNIKNPHYDYLPQRSGTCRQRQRPQHIEDTRNIDDNESTNSSETLIAFRGLEADGCLSNLLHNSQADSQEKYTAYGNKQKPEKVSQQKDWTA